MQKKSKLGPGKKEEQITQITEKGKKEEREEEGNGEKEVAPPSNNI